MIVRYLRLAVWPSGLVLDYGPPRPLALGDVLWPAAIVLGVLAAVAVAWRYSRRLGFLAASAVLTLAPASSLIPVHTEVGAERRMYVPMMALTILAVVGVHTWSRQYLSGKASRLNALFAVGVCAALAVATVQRNSEFASPLSIWQTVVDRWPHGRARYNLSMALEAAGRGDEAMAMLRASVADYPEARSILGFHLLDQGQVEEGIDELRAFLRERPAQANAVLAHGRIAEALYAKREYAAALPEYRESLARRPDQIAWWTDYAISLAATGNSGEAVRAFERVTALRPGEANAHRNLANALLDHGDYARAEQEATEAARLAPGDPVVTEILSLARGGQQSGHAGHSPHGPAPVESSMAPGSQTIPTEAVVLEFARRQAMPRAGIGTAHDPVGTVSKEAQALYDRGLAYLQSYWWLEAARCFNQALSLDPALAVAQASLSIAYTELNAPGAAGESLARATDASGKSSDHDRRHIELRAMQMAAEKAGRWDATALGQYRAAIEAALAKFPSDEELWLLRGLAESPDPAERGQGSPASAVQYYRKALTLSPGHFAGHHYLTHAYENSGQVNEALAEGATYAKMAPGVPHARHMHGHNLRRVGRVEEAIGEFEAADAIETSYFKAERIPVELDWHYQHNIDLLATAYQYTGRMAKAEARLRASFAIPSVLVQQEFNKREWPVFLIGRGRGQEALDAATVMAGHRSPIVSAAGHVMMGQARLAMGQYQAAADEANTALRTMRAAPLGAGIVANALQELQGEFLLRTGQRDKGRTMLEDLVKKVRAGPGPDAWTQALFTIESIARTSRDADDWEFAAWAAKQMIDHDPNYAGSHFALGLVARHQGDRITARAQFELARRYWKNADADLVELQTVTKELAPPE
jgi:tetratricopeptide (TPR) repeat protein